MIEQFSQTELDSMAIDEATGNALVIATYWHRRDQSYLCLWERVNDHWSRRRPWSWSTGFLLPTTANEIQTFAGDVALDRVASMEGLPLTMELGEDLRPG
jgi:hypothetical protein